MPKHSITTHNLSTVPHAATELFSLIPRPLSLTATALIRALVEAGPAAPAVRAIGVDAVLIGEALMSSQDPEQAVRDLCGDDMRTREHEIPQ